MTTDLAREIRDGLHRRAASITPSADGLDRIRNRLDAAAAGRGRRRPPGVLLAAAAVIAIAVIGGVLWAIDDDPSTKVATTQEHGLGPASGEGVDTTTTTVTTAVEPAADTVGPGVWPWPVDDVDAVDRTDPREVALRYLLSRFEGDLGETTASEFQQGDPTSGEVVVTGDVETTVLVRIDDGGQWYVVAALSDRLELVVLDDGAVESRPRVAGELTGNAEGPLVAADQRGPVPVTPDMTASFQPQGGDVEVGILRHWFTLTTDDGVTGFTEVRVDHAR